MTWHFRGHRVSMENQLLSASRDNKQTCVHSWRWCCDKCCWELCFFLASSKLAGTIVCHNIDIGCLIVTGQCWWLGGTESGSAGGPTRFRPTIPLNHTTHSSGLVPLLSAEFSVGHVLLLGRQCYKKRKRVFYLQSICVFPSFCFFPLEFCWTKLFGLEVFLTKQYVLFPNRIWKQET